MVQQAFFYKCKLKSHIPAVFLSSGIIFMCLSLVGQNGPFTDRLKRIGQNT
tara:strand:- start:15042 stop:15194 length:153 start_codon:yes stop_codon:yes gene_type:complete